jgi:aryl-alcohol dehydrogenase-like predicted oxidoreductase
VRTGKVRYVGARNFSAWHLVKSLGVARLRGYEPFACHHIHYSLLVREAEYELVPAAIDQGLGVLVWSPLAGGWLSGKYARGRPAPAGSRHLGAWDEPPVRSEERLYDWVDVLTDIGNAHGVSTAQGSLAWLLGRPAVSSLVIGARTEEQLADNLSAVHPELSEGQRQRLHALTAPPLIYPYWHQAKLVWDQPSPADWSLLGPYILSQEQPRSPDPPESTDRDEEGRAA